MSNTGNTLYLMIGKPACGKTTVGQAIARARSAAFLDIDLSTESLIQTAMKALAMNIDDRDSDRFKTLFRKPVYDTLFDLARANIGHTDVVLTGPFTSEFSNQNWIKEIELSMDCPCSVQAYHMHCSLIVQRDRMQRRGNPRDNGKLENWDVFQSYYEKQQAPLFPHQSVDTGKMNRDEIDTFVKSLLE